MADGMVTSQIKSNTNAAESKYTATLAQLQSDVAKLKDCVTATINGEIDRLIDKDEKKRIMDSYSDEIIKKKVRALKPDEFFTIIGVGIQDIPNAESAAVSVMKPSDLKKPDGYPDITWDLIDLDNKKSVFYASLPDAEKQKYVFKGIPDSEKIAKVKADPEIFFETLTEDDKLYLIAQYSAREDEKDGTRQGFNNKLEKSQKRKDRLKEAIKKAANSVIKSMEDTIAVNDNLIKQLEAQIIKKKQELMELEQKPIDISKYYQAKNQALSPDQLEAIEKRAKAEAIGKMEKSIEDLEKDLIAAKDAQKEARTKLNEYKKQIEDMLAGKNIYVGSQAINENDSTRSSTLPDAAANRFGNAATGNSQLKQHQKAKNMLHNMMLGTDVQDFRDMLRMYSYKDLSAMAMQLRGPFSKRNLENFYQTAFTDMRDQDGKKKINTILKAKFGPDFKLSSLRNMNNMSAEQIKKIQGVLTELNDNYSIKSQKEKEEIDLIMDYFKVGMLMRETEHFKGIKNIWRSITNNEKAQRFKFLRTQLTRHSQNVYDEKNSIVDRYNSFRESIHVAGVDKSKIIRNPKTPNRTGRDEYTL